MSWITPKTNWTSDDKFDANSFNRINGNLNELGDIANKIFPNHLYKSLPSNKSYSDFFYADEMNDIENKLYDINLYSLQKQIGNIQTYAPNQPTPDYNEYNRIEGASLSLYTELKADKDILPKLKVRLGNVKGVKV